MPLNAFVPEAVVEVLHGVTVDDPYRCLEDRSSPVTEAWICEQQKRYDAYFSQIPGLGWLRARVSDFLNIECMDQPAKVGNRYFYRRRKKDQEQAGICMRDLVNGVERVLVNPAVQGRYDAVAIHRISDDGLLLAYELRHGGSDAKAIHIVDVEQSHTLPDHLETGYTRGFFFAPDGIGFYYCHELPGSTGPYMIQFHRFGNASNQDEVIFKVDRGQQGKLLLLADEFRLGAMLVHADGNDSLIDLYLSGHTCSSQWDLAFANIRALHGVFLQNGQIFAITDEGAPKRQIIELAEDGSVRRTVVPPWDCEILRLAIANGDLFVAYIADRQPVVHRWTFGGDYLGSVKLPKGGSLELLPCLSTTPNALFYVHESFGEPPHVLEYQDDSGDHISWSTPPGERQRIALKVESVSYLSKDGTEIPMSLVMSAGTDKERVHPVILTSYGGFGTSMTPKFSVLVTIMLELGAVFALPKIRGGSEFGKAWHQAARGRNRQVAFDDFIAAADWLCAQGITTPQALAVFGGSNSGLLVGAAVTQRPELFRAALCIAPLLDMVRYERFDSARKWRHEYGTVDDAEDFSALYAYSPYHQVRDDVNYPSTLFVSGDMDDRCNPAHVRKMAALLQQRRSQLHSILVDYSQHRGHSPVLPLFMRVEALARRIAFLCHELGMDIRLEESNETSRS